MPYQSETLDRLYVVRWEDPVASDVARMEREVAQVARRASESLHGLSIVPARTSPPDEATRTAMGKSMPSLLDHLATMHVAIEGTGFAHTILRSAMTGIILVGGKRGRVFVHASVADAVGEIASVAAMDEARLRSLLDVHGFLATA